MANCGEGHRLAFGPPAQQVSPMTDALGGATAEDCVPRRAGTRCLASSRRTSPFHVGARETIWAERETIWAEREIILCGRNPESEAALWHRNPGNVGLGVIALGSFSRYSVVSC
jgi:hypothetical protein